MPRQNRVVLNLSYKEMDKIRHVADVLGEDISTICRMWVIEKLLNMPNQGKIME